MTSLDSCGRNGSSQPSVRPNRSRRCLLNKFQTSQSGNSSCKPVNEREAKEGNIRHATELNRKNRLQSSWKLSLIIIMYII